MAQVAGVSGLKPNMASTGQAPVKPGENWGPTLSSKMACGMASGAKAQITRDLRMRSRVGIHCG